MFQEQNYSGCCCRLLCRGNKTQEHLRTLLPHSVKGAQIAETRYDGLPVTHTPSAPTIWLAATALCTGTPEWHGSQDAECCMFAPESCSETSGVVTGQHTTTATAALLSFLRAAQPCSSPTAHTTGISQQCVAGTYPIHPCALEMLMLYVESTDSSYSVSS